MAPPSKSTCDIEQDTHPTPRAGSNRRSILLAAVLVLAGVANQARSLRWGFFYDDFAHQIILRHGQSATGVPRWNVYDFGAGPTPQDTMRRWGVFPWWTSSDFKARFFRPVTSLTILMDFGLWDDWAPGYHLTSLVLFGIFLALSFRLFRDLGAPPAAALWALALLALEDSHVIPVGWIANRNTLLAALFTVATLLTVHHHQRTGRVGYLLAAMLCFLLAFGSKESGLIAMPIAVLYLLLIDRRSAGESLRDGCRRVMRSPLVWVFVVLTAGYVVFYVAGGYGAQSVQYLMPWSAPLGYLVRYLALIPLGLMALLLGLTTDIVFAGPELVWPVAGASVLVLAGLGYVLWRTLGPTRSANGWSRLAGFALAWTLVSLFPVAGVTPPSDRLLMNASVGTALLIGLLLHRLGPVRALMAERRYGRLALAGLFVTVGVVLAVPATWLHDTVFTKMASLDRDAIANADIDRTAPAPRSVFILNSPSSLLALSVLPTWQVIHDDYAIRIFALQMGRRAVVWHRDGERTMTLTFPSSVLLDLPFEALFVASAPPPPAGTTYATTDFAATVQAVEPTGIRTVRFTFNKPLDDPSYQFLAFARGRLTRIAPPPPGQQIELPEVEPLMRFAP